MESMVVISASPTTLTGVTQERRGCPSICTVQAPQAATPQPNLVPVRLSSSLITQSSGVSESASISRDSPFILIVSAIFKSSEGYAGWHAHVWCNLGSWIRDQAESRKIQQEKFRREFNACEVDYTRPSYRIIQASHAVSKLTCPHRLIVIATRVLTSLPDRITLLRKRFSSLQLIL